MRQYNDINITEQKTKRRDRTWNDDRKKRKVNTFNRRSNTDNDRNQQENKSIEGQKQ